MSRLLQIIKRALTGPSVIILAAFLVRFAAMLIVHSHAPTPPMQYFKYGYEAGDVAASIATGHGFSSPFGDSTGPTAWFTPLYPYLLAGIFKIFGVYTFRSFLVALTLNCVFVAFTSLALYYIGREAFSRAVGIGAAWLWAFAPAGSQLAISWVWDTCMAAMMVSLIFWATLKMREAGSVRTWVGYGALWALGILTNPAILAVLPFLLFWLVFQDGARARERLQSAAVAVLVIGLGITPWLVRNYAVFGTFVGLRSNLGLELYLGNNEKATDTWPFALHPSLNPAERAQYRQMGEIAYMKEKQRQAVHYMLSSPGEAAHWTLRRFIENWTGISDPLIDTWPHVNWGMRLVLIYHCTFPVLTFLGLFLASRNGRPAAFPLAAIILFYPIVYYFTHASLRYRYPIDPIMAVLAVYAVACGLSQIAWRFQREGTAMSEHPTAKGYSEI